MWIVTVFYKWGSSVRRVILTSEALRLLQECIIDHSVSFIAERIPIV